MLLERLDIARAPLRYGTDACCIQLCDSSYSRDIAGLRSSELGPYINQLRVSEEEHERWMASRFEKRDILDFVILIQGTFSGTVSLTDIKHGEKCELGRMIIRNNGSRVYALAVEFLGMSFGFEMLGLERIYCAVVEGNEPILRLHLRNGWKLSPGFDRDAVVNGSRMHLLGLSVERAEWPNCFSGMRRLVRRLLDKQSAPKVVEA